MKSNLVLVGFSLCMAFSGRGMAAEVVDETGAGAQRAACDARCREDFQNNAAALQACLRDCGAIGQATTVKGSKSNSSERKASPAVPPPEPAKAANLNLSKSNINRSAGSPDPCVQPAEATTVKSSKSNSNERQASPDSCEPAPGDG